MSLVGLLAVANIVMGLASIASDILAIGQADSGVERGCALSWLVIDVILLFTGLSIARGFGGGARVVANGAIQIASKLLTPAKIAWILEQVLASQALWLLAKSLMIRGEVIPDGGGGGGNPPTSQNVWEIKDTFPEGSDESRELAEFVKAWNEELEKVGTMICRRLDEAEKRASRLWKELMRKSHPEIYTSPDIVVGHVPDAAAGGPAAGGRAMPLRRTVNASVGGQVGWMPVGFEYSKVVIVHEK